MRRILAAALAALLLALPAAAQTAPQIGPTFGAELAAAGCADGVAWSADGSLTVDPALGDAARSCVAKVRAAHDPTRQPTRRAPLSVLLDPLSPAQRASITADHMARLQAEAVEQGGTLPIGNAKVARAAGDLGMTPDAWFRLAGF